MSTFTAAPCQTKTELVLKLTRTIAAPRHAVYQAWREQEALRHWSAPKHFTIAEAEGNCRPGGMWHCCMISPDGHEYRVGGVYYEILPDEKLVFTHVWQEEEGLGKETVVTVCLADEDNGTRMEFEQSGFASIESRDGHAAGWNECFDLLEQYLRESPGHGVSPHPFS